MRAWPLSVLAVAGAILGAIVSLLTSIASPPMVLREDMPGPYFVYGVYNPETAPDGTTYRWTTSHATLTFPYAANLGQYSKVSIRLAGNRAPGQPPAQVTVSLNGKAFSAFTAPPSFGIYTEEINSRATPNPYLNPANVQVDITSTTVAFPQDPRSLGVAVDWITLTPVRSRTEMFLEAGVWAVALFLVTLIASSRLGRAWAIVYGGGALAVFLALHLTYLPRAIGPAVEVALAGLAFALAAWLAPRERPLWALGLAACGLWLVVVGRLLGDWQMDDAYISYRYAWNFAHGSGLVYNPGEVVEGYTNFLWTLLASASIALGLHPSVASLAATIACAIGLAALTFHLAGRRTGGEQQPGASRYLWPLVAAALMVVDVGVATYGGRGSGIEAVPFAFLVLLSIFFLWHASERVPSGRCRVAGGVALGLAALTRPEGLLVAALLLGVRAWQDRRAGKGALRLARYALLPFALLVVPYEAWRISFYGYPFPNTFYTKTGASIELIVRGLQYCAEFAARHWLLVALLAVGLMLALPRLRRKSPTAERDPLPVALGVLVAGYTLYIIWVGGDYFPADRFFVPLLAPIVLLAVGAAHDVAGRIALPRLRPPLRTGAIAIGLLAFLYGGFAIWLEDPQGDVAKRTRGETFSVDHWGSAGLWLRDNTPPDTWTAAQGAGAIAYYSQRRVIDMFGLNDLHIGHLQIQNMGSVGAGHEKRDPAYVLSRKPDYILAYWQDYFDPISDELKAEYSRITVRLPNGADEAWWRLKQR